MTKSSSERKAKCLPSWKASFRYKLDESWQHSKTIKSYVDLQQAQSHFDKGSRFEYEAKPHITIPKLLFG